MRQKTMEKPAERLAVQPDLDLGIKNKKLVNIPKKEETGLAKLKLLAKEEEPEHPVSVMSEQMKEDRDERDKQYGR